MKTRRILALLLAACMAIALIGCGQSNTPAESNPPAQPNTPAESNTPAEPAAPAEPAGSGMTVEEFLARGIEKNVIQSVATGTGSGKQFVFMSAIGSVVSEQVKNLQWNMETSNGSIDNLNQLQAGNFDFGFAQQDGAYEAYTGTGDFATAYEGLRAVFPCYTQDFFIATTSEKVGNNTITDFSVLDGLSAGMGSVTGSLWVSVMKLQTIFDLSKIDFRELTTADTFNQMAEGKMDLSMGIQGQPNSNISEYVANSANPPLYHPEFSDEIIDKVIENFPFYSRVVIPGDTYSSLNGNDYHTYGCWAFVYCDKDMDNLVTYNVCKTLFENTDDLAITVDSFKNLTAEQITNSVVPLQTGAIWYYEEQGIELPAELYPAEYISLEDYVASLS